MKGILASIIRFLAMHLPLQSMRIAMYRSAGIRIGNVSVFGSNIWISLDYKNLVNIEDGVILAGYNTILSHSFLFARARGPEDYYYEKDGFFPVIIKKRARIGMHVVILPGVTIGENSVIGACSVVTRDIPPNCVAAGVPARPIRYIGSSGALSDKLATKDRKTLPNHKMLYVKCKTCGIEFCSMIRCDKKIFSMLDFRDNWHICPNGHKNRYDKKDYYYKD